MGTQNLKKVPMGTRVPKWGPTWEQCFHYTLFLQYKIGQLYMIAKHSAEQSQKGEGVEVVENRPHSDPVRLITLLDFFSSSLSSSQVHGDGQFTEKRIYISR